MNSIKNVAKLAVRARQLHTSRALNKLSPEEQTAKGYALVKAQQVRFQADNDLPVHLKGGVVDVVLMRITWGLVFVGLGMTAELFWTMAWPRND